MSAQNRLLKGLMGTALAPKLGMIIPAKIVSAMIFASSDLGPARARSGGRVNLMSNDSAFGRLNAALLAGAFGAAMAAASPANALLMISVDDGVNSSVFTDNVGADFDNRLGVLGIYISSGNFQLVLSLAQSQPFIGSPTDPIIDLTFAMTSFGDGGTLTISVTNTDFQGSGTNVGVCEIGGITGGTVDYACFVDDSNTAFARTEQIAGLGPISGGVFAEAANGAFDVNGLYSLTDVLTITHGGGIVTTTGNSNIRIPEPQTLAIFGMGLVAIGLLLWRRRSREAVRV